MGEIYAPAAPEELHQTGVEREVLVDLTLKLGSHVSSFTTEWAARELRLPLHLTEELCWQLKQDHLVDVLGQNGPFCYKYSLTQRGRDHASKLSQVSGYVGPAPVSLAAYSDFLRQQSRRQVSISPAQVAEVISELVVPQHAIEIASLAAASRRSLFVFGPPGNGKTSLGRLLHRVFTGGIWIPHCLGLGHQIVRIFDPQVHHTIKVPEGLYDRRWVYVQRPFLVVGGEMTMADLDLAYSPGLRFYEAPAHVKANGGTLLIDDFGRQRIDPRDLLNRWIVPLEHEIDFLTLHTGQRIQVPFQLMLIVATNLSVEDVADAAFLRRMGYRLNLNGPDAMAYAQIWKRYAERIGATGDQDTVEYVITRYQNEGRDLRASEPRDLLERCRDICRLRQTDLVITRDIIDLAWTGYFGTPSNTVSNGVNSLKNNGSFD
jgi:hypothetical protein